jgi:hypothetical protein
MTIYRDELYVQTIRTMGTFNKPGIIIFNFGSKIWRTLNTELPKSESDANTCETKACSVGVVSPILSIRDRLFLGTTYYWEGKKFIPKSIITQSSCTTGITSDQITCFDQSNGNVEDISISTENYVKKLKIFSSTSVVYSDGNKVNSSLFLIAIMLLISYLVNLN